MPKMEEEGRDAKNMSWSIEEFVKRERSWVWYMLFFCVLGMLLLYSVFTANFLFALIILMFLFLTLLSQFQKPRPIRIEVSHDGVRVGEEFHPYRQIKEFWIIYQPPEVKTLYLRFKDLFSPRLSLHLADQDPVRLRDILAQYVEENLDEEDEAFSDTMSRILKI